MAFHILTYHRSDPAHCFVDLYLGSGASVDHNWTAVARDLNLPIMSGMAEQAFCEEGFRISGLALMQLKNELALFETYWKETIGAATPAHDLLATIRTVVEGVDHAIDHGLYLVVC